ncbi:MAG: dethiobiotin synthetase, partial [Pseudonocardiaceae bacterium]
MCGPRHCTDEDTTHAYEVGRLLARAGAVVICGGGTGVMAAAAAAAGARAEK